jgi:hypothetical protein
MRKMSSYLWGFTIDGRSPAFVIRDWKHGENVEYIKRLCTTMSIISMNEVIYPGVRDFFHEMNKHGNWYDPSLCEGWVVNVRDNDISLERSPKAEKMKDVKFDVTHKEWNGGGQAVEAMTLDGIPLYGESKELCRDDHKEFPSLEEWSTRQMAQWDKIQDDYMEPYCEAVEEEWRNE